MKKIAILASGSGSNAENIANYFKDNSELEISLILTNKKDAYVLERAKKLNIPSLVFNRKQFVETDEIVSILQEKEIESANYLKFTSNVENIKDCEIFD